MTGQTLGGGIPLVRSLPATPTDGAIIAYQDNTTLIDGTNTMAALGIAWLLRYNGQSASTYKWEQIGGVPLVVESVANLSTTSTTYVTAMTGGNMPSLTLPAVAGDWDIQLFASEFLQQSGGYGRMSYMIGAAAAVDPDSIALNVGTTINTVLSLTAVRRKTGIAASTVLQTQARVTSGTVFPNNGNNAPFGLRAIPVRLG